MKRYRIKAYNQIKKQTLNRLAMNKFQSHNLCSLKLSVNSTWNRDSSFLVIPVFIAIPNVLSSHLD